jgi:hypothetical protein
MAHSSAHVEHEHQRKGDKLLAVMAQGYRTVEEAADRAQMSATTAHRFLSRPMFKDRLKAAHDAATVEAVVKLRAATNRAVEVLVELLGSRSESIRLKAARSICEFALPTGAQEPTVTEEQPRMTDAELLVVFHKMGDAGYFASEPGFTEALGAFAAELLLPEPDQRRLSDKRFALVRMAFHAKELRDGVTPPPELDAARFGGSQ